MRSRVVCVCGGGVEARGAGRTTRNDRFIDPNSDFDICVILHKPM